MNKRTMAAVLMMLTVLVSPVSVGQPDDTPRKMPKGWLGVQIQDITAELKRSMDLETRDGAFVNEVVRKSPADSAGIKEEDIIVQFNGKDISDSEDLRDAVGKTKPGTRIPVVLLREGEKKTLQVVIGQYPRQRARLAVAPREARRLMILGEGFGTQGLALSELNEQLSRYFDAPEGEGVLVWEVEKESPAEKAGIKAGDVITRVGKKLINDVRDVSRAFRAYDEGEKVDVEVIRKGARKTFTLEVRDEGDFHGFNFRLERPHLPRFREFEFNFVPDIEFDLPRVELNHIGPDLDVLRLELDKMKDQIRDQTQHLKRELKLHALPRIHVWLPHEI